MKTRPVCVLWVCVCCLFAREGDGDGCDGNGGCAGSPWALLEEDDEVTAGMLAERHVCGREHGLEVDECDCERRNFSHSSCDGCGSPLGGSRHAYTLWVPNE
jgi:hypothetical protein